MPTYSGYDDQMTANAFLLALRRFEQATGISESEVLRRVLLQPLSTMPPGVIE